MDGSRKVVTIAVIIAIVAALTVFAVQQGTQLSCADGESGCIDRARALRDDCIPSVTTIQKQTDEGLITILINITRQGDDCIIDERVLDIQLNEGEEFDLYDVKCIVPLGVIGDPFECEGSLFDYLTEGGGGGGDSGAHQGRIIYTIVCSADDIPCKRLALEYIQTCQESRIKDTERIWTEFSFWTKDIIVERRPPSCLLFIKIIDLINPPAHIPRDIIGMELECSFPLDPIGDPPIENLTLDYCLGPLFEYIYD